MKIIKPSVTINKDKDAVTILKNLEYAGRVCYNSVGKITDESYKLFIRNILKHGHLAVIEHESITAEVVCDRAIANQIVRHRLASYGQESTRYVNYKEGIEVIEPNCFWKIDDTKTQMRRAIWLNAMTYAEDSYQKMIEHGATPDEARSVLPSALATKLVMTYNLRQWRHFFKLRCEKHAHPQMKEIADMLLDEMVKYLPEIFGDIKDNFSKSAIVDRLLGVKQ